MRALPGPSGRTGVQAFQRARPEPLAIPSLQRSPIQQNPPPKSGNIVERAVVRLVGAVLLEANDEWQLQHRYMQLGAIAELATPDAGAETLGLPPLAA